MPQLYRIDFDDRVDTIGLGATIDNVWRRWDLGINYRYSKGEGDIRNTDLSPGGGSTAFPTLSNELHHIELSAAYDLKKHTRPKLAAIYQELTARDWAVDGVSPYPDNRLLTLGNDSEDYDVFAFMIALQHRF